MGVISFNSPDGQRKVSKAELLGAKADAALAEIDADNQQIAADLTAIDAATQAQVKEMVKRLLQGLRRNNLRQRKLLSYLKHQV